MWRICLYLIISAVIVQALKSTKKGLAVSPREYQCDDLNSFDNIHWWYDWSLAPAYEYFNDCTNVPSQERVPMSWGWRDSSNITDKVPNTSNYFLGWNEPNVRGQANLTPAKAAQYWPLLQAQSTGKSLVSPSAAPCGNPGHCISNWKQWFDEFFALCSDCKIDYVATHYYGDSSCNTDWVISHVRQVYKRYNKPVWLTEFSCPNEDPAVVLKYMKILLPRLEAEAGLFRYSWYESRRTRPGWIGPSTSLLRPETSELTPLGKFYNDFEPSN